MPRIIEAKQITKKFYDPHEIDLLKGISLNIDSGKRIGIVGKSGEGKTTLLHILGTIDDPTSGSLFFYGEEMKAAQRDHLRNAHFGFIFQAFHLMNDMSVIENILLPAKVARKSTKKGSTSYSKANELLELVKLTDRAYHPAKRLSGGERQRVAIARAFINDPDVIFADEPTGNLDHATAQEVSALLLSSVQNFKKALVLVTHNTDLARLMDNCYVLENGFLNENY